MNFVIKTLQLSSCYKALDTLKIVSRPDGPVSHNIMGSIKRGISFKIKLLRYNVKGEKSLVMSSPSVYQLRFRQSATWANESPAVPDPVDPLSTQRRVHFAMWVLSFGLFEPDLPV